MYSIYKTLDHWYIIQIKSNDLQEKLEKRNKDLQTDEEIVLFLTKIKQMPWEVYKKLSVDDIYNLEVILASIKDKCKKGLNFNDRKR